MLNKCLIKGLHLLPWPQPLRKGDLIVPSMKTHPLIKPSTCTEWEWEWEKVLNKCLIKGLHLLLWPQPLRKGDLIVPSVKTHPLINPSTRTETLLCCRRYGRHRGSQDRAPSLKECVYNKVEGIK